MFLPPPDLTVRKNCGWLPGTRSFSTQRARRFGGFTLPELLVSMMIFSLLSAVIGSLSLAVHTAWTFSESMERARHESDAFHQRLNWMIRQTATYRDSSGVRQPGIFVIEQWSSAGLSANSSGDLLVLWSGGSNGNLAGGDFPNRTPLLSELVVYTWDAAPAPVLESQSESSPLQTTARRLVEVTFPEDSQTVSFDAANFAATIREAVLSPAARRLPIITRLAITHLESTGNPSAPSFRGAIRFQLRQSPSPNELASAVRGSQAWKELPWYGGFCSNSAGQRVSHISWQIAMDPHASSAVSLASGGTNSASTGLLSGSQGVNLFVGSALKSWLHEGS